MEEEVLVEVALGFVDLHGGVECEEGTERTESVDRPWGT